MCVYRRRVYSQRLGTVFYGVLDTALLNKNTSYAAIGIWTIVGFYFNRFKIVGEGIIQPTLFFKSHSQNMVTHVIVGCHINSVGKKSDAVYPMAHLEPGTNHQDRKEQTSRYRKHNPCMASPSQQVVEAPGDHHKEANNRNIRIPIGHTLHTHLNESDYRDKGSKIPQPPNYKIRGPSRCPKRQNKQANQQCSGTKGLPPSYCAWIWIEDRKVAGPEHLPDVG